MQPLGQNIDTTINDKLSETVLNDSLQSSLLFLGPDSFLKQELQDSRASRRCSKSESENTGSSASGCSGLSTEHLIVRITSPSTCDLEFTHVFLMLYRKFMTPLELLDSLLERFDQFDCRQRAGDTSSSSLHPVVVRVCNVIMLWMEQYFGDFSSEKMRFTMHVFVGALSNRPPFADISQQMTEMLFCHVPAHPNRQGWDWNQSVDSDDEQGFYAAYKDTPNAFSSRAGFLAAHRSSIGVWNGYEREVRRVGSAPLSQSEMSFSPVSPPTPEAPLFSLAKRINMPQSSSSSVVSSASSSATSAAVSRATSPSGAKKPGLLASLFMSTPDPSATVSFSSHQTSAILDLLAIRPASIAEQLCLLEFDVFKVIGPRDFLQHIWGKHHKGQHAPSVTASIAHFNFISSWVTTCVLSHPKTKTRSKILSTFIKIAEHVRRLNNFNTLMAILAGINSASVLRLKKTRRLLFSKRGRDVYSELERQMSSEKSFSKYRYCLRRSEAPCVPYLGVFLRDLLYIEEANKDFRSDGSINLPKFLLIGDILLMIQSFQLRPYTFQADDQFRSYLFAINVLSEDEAYQRSLELEPKQNSISAFSASNIKRFI